MIWIILIVVYFVIAMVIQGKELEENADNFTAFLTGALWLPLLIAVGFYSLRDYINDKLNSK